MGLTVLRGALWGLVLLAHVCALSVVVLTTARGFPSFGETARSVGNIVERYHDVKDSGRQLTEARDTEAFGQSAIEVQKRLDSLKDAAGGGPNVPAIQMISWLLLGFVGISLAFLTVCWWRVGFRGLIAYTFFAMLLIPFSLGALGLATAMLDSVPQDRRSFELSVRGFQKLGGDALPFLTDLNTIVACTLLPAIAAAGRSRTRRR